MVGAKWVHCEERHNWFLMLLLKSWPFAEVAVIMSKGYSAHSLPWGTATVIILIIKLILCGVCGCITPAISLRPCLTWRWTENRYMHSDPRMCCAHESETGMDESVQVLQALTLKNWQSHPPCLDGGRRRRREGEGGGGVESEGIISISVAFTVLHCVRYGAFSHKVPQHLGSSQNPTMWMIQVWAIRLEIFTGYPTAKSL